jgi:hypothetical protein
LAPVPGSPFPAGTGAFNATVDTTGTFLYVPNAYSSNVSAYVINPISGALTPVPGSPFSTGTTPVWMAIIDETPTAAVSVLPNHGGNAGNVTVQVFGGAFQSGASVKLTGLGSDIAGTNTTIPYPSALATTFDLTGATPGVRNVVVTNPDNTTSTLAGGFTVEQGGAPQIWVDIIGRNQIRIGTAQTYYVVVGNRGNIDSSASRIWVAFPTGITWGTPSQLPSAAGQTDGSGFVAFDVSASAGSSIAIPILLQAGSGFTGTFQIQGWVEQ